MESASPTHQEPQRDKLILPLVDMHTNLSDIVHHCEDLIQSTPLQPNTIEVVSEYAVQGLAALAYQILETSQSLEQSIHYLAALDLQPMIFEIENLSQVRMFIANEGMFMFKLYPFRLLQVLMLINSYV
jgi:hypothetical protein